MAVNKIVIFESKSYACARGEYVCQRVVVKHETAWRVPVFHFKNYREGYYGNEYYKVKSYIGKKYIPEFEAIVRISDLKVLKYTLYKQMKGLLKIKHRHPAALDHSNAKEFHDLVKTLRVRVSRRKLATRWDKLLDAWNELNPENKLPGYVDLNEECEGLLEWPCLGYFKACGEECGYDGPWDYVIFVLSHVADYCPESTRKIYIQYKNRKNGGFAVIVDVVNFKPLKWRFGKAAHGGKISVEHYERIKKILCNVILGSFYFQKMFKEIETKGFFNARKYYGKL